MAQFVNKFQVYAYDDLVRIVFEDCVTGTEGLITSQVIMRTVDAEALGTVLGETIKKHRRPPDAA